MMAAKNRFLRKKIPRKSGWKNGFVSYMLDKKRMVTHRMKPHDLRWTRVCFDFFQHGGPQQMKPIIAVAIGGLVGTWLRVLVSFLLSGHAFPWATLLVNWIGCFCLAWLLHTRHSDRLSSELRLALGTGLIGSFTTFSAFSAEVLALENLALQAAYAFLSIVGGLMMAGMGMIAGKRAAGRRQHG
jgi:CrcB protein